MASKNQRPGPSFVIFFLLLLSLFIISKQVPADASDPQNLLCPTPGAKQNGLQMVGCTVPTTPPTVFVAQKAPTLPPPTAAPPGSTLSSSKVPLYKQWDPRWGGLPFGNCGTDIASSGCGPTSLAMVISYWENKAILPSQTAKQAVHECGVGTTYASLISVPELYGLHSKVVSWDEAKRYLQQGIPVINVQRKGYFTKHGHYIVVTEINANGTYAINDPDGFHRTQATEAQITASRVESWVITK